MRISDWSSDVCSSDLARPSDQREAAVRPAARSADLPGPLCRLAAVNGETVGIGDVLYPDVVLEPAARHALILAGPDQFDAAPIATLVVGPRLDGADRCLLGQVEFGGGGLHEFPILWRQGQTTPRNVIQLDWKH